MWTARLRAPRRQAKNAIFCSRSRLFAFTVTAVVNPFTHFLFTIDRATTCMREMWRLFSLGRIMGISDLPDAPHARAFLRGTTSCGAWNSASALLYYRAVCGKSDADALLRRQLDAARHYDLHRDDLSGDSGRSDPDRRADRSEQPAGTGKLLEDHIQRHVGEALSLVMIDVNHFKSINDRYGHMVGDRR